MPSSKLIFLVGLLCSASSYLKAALVHPDSVAKQKSLLTRFSLANGVEVNYYQQKGSEIAHVEAQWSTGTRDLSPKDQVALRLLLPLMPQGAEGYPKDRLYALLEKYSAGINCESAIRQVSCNLSVVNEHFEQLWPAFVATLKSPQLSEQEFKVLKAQQVMGLKAGLERPEQRSNEIVNSIFYPMDHPYQNQINTDLQLIEKVQSADLKRLHKGLLNAKLLRLVIVGSLDQAKLKGLIEGGLKSLPAMPPKAVKVPVPSLKKGQKQAAFLEKPLPSSYIRIKFVAPGPKAPDLMATKLMVHVLNERISQRIRTELSLSYAAYSGLLVQDFGIGLIAASTSKPKETLVALAQLIREFKAKPIGAEELRDYKNEYLTSYYLTLETHERLANALGEFLLDDSNPASFFDQMSLLEKVSADEVAKSAQKYLKDFKLGVVGSKTQYQEIWAEEFLKSL